MMNFKLIHWLFYWMSVCVFDKQPEKSNSYNSFLKHKVKTQK